MSPNYRKTPPRAFTLIELLVAAAIVGILSLVALPNLMDASARSKIARMRSNMRVVSEALECYHLDRYAYPPPRTNRGWFFSRSRLTTPIAYIESDETFRDVFGLYGRNVETGNFFRRKAPGYMRYYTFDLITGNCTNANDDTYGFYVLASNGPDQRRFENVGARISNSDTDEEDFTEILGQIYDPTNGTVSTGELLRFGAAPPLRAHRIAGIVGRQ